PPYLRVKVWRRLQALGAVPLKNSVYALPNTDEAREDLAWVLREIEKEGGEAALCEPRPGDGLTDDGGRGLFPAAPRGDYRALASDIRTFAQQALPSRSRALSEEARAEVEAGLAKFRKRLSAVAQIDFFGAPGRQAVEGLITGLEQRIAPARSGAVVAPSR